MCVCVCVWFKLTSLGVGDRARFREEEECIMLIVGGYEGGIEVSADESSDGLEVFLLPPVTLVTWELAMIPIIIIACMWAAMKYNILNLIISTSL